MRLITNKPNQDEFEASIDFGMSSTSGGAGSNNVEAMINIPLSDRAAVRFVGYSDNQGGWIDNVSGTLHRTVRLSIVTTQLGTDPSSVTSH